MLDRAELVLPSRTLLKSRPSLVDAAFEYAATYPPTPGVCTSTVDLSRCVAWSVAEASAAVRHAELPTELRPGSGGPGIFVEKSLIDAFYPLNVTISLVSDRHP